MNQVLLRNALLTALLLAGPAWLQAAEHVVDQKGKSFSVDHLKVKVGDSVSFKNADPYFHNVYSMSDAKSFDLGSYPQGKAKAVVFEKEGSIEVECAIHPNMKMTVEVTK